MGPRSGWPLLSRSVAIIWRMTIFAALARAVPDAAG